MTLAVYLHSQFDSSGWELTSWLIKYVRVRYPLSTSWINPFLLQATNIDTRSHNIPMEIIIRGVPTHVPHRAGGGGLYA